MRRLRGHVGYVVTVAFRKSVRQVITADSSGMVQLWDSESGKHLHRFRLEEAPVARAFSEEGRRVLSASCGVGLWVSDLGTGKLLRRLRGPSV